MEDDFRMGINLIPKETQGKIKLFTAFEKSNIIVSSPLGLRLRVADPNEIEKE